MSRHEAPLQFTSARNAVVAPVGFRPARLDKWTHRRRVALIASATIGLWALLLVPGGYYLA